MKTTKQEELEIEKLAMDFCNRLSVNYQFLIPSIKELLKEGILLDEIKSGRYDLEVLRRQRNYLKAMKEQRLKKR